MLNKRGDLKLFVFLVTLVFFSAGVAAVTLNVWSSVERGGVLNEEGNVNGSVDDWAATTQFSECLSGQGEYVTGLRLSRNAISPAGPGMVNTQVSCEKIGSGNNFNVNSTWDDVSPDCSVGQGIFSNIAVGHQLQLIPH